jgi:Phosphodiester glycosidase
MDTGANRPARTTEAVAIPLRRPARRPRVEIERLALGGGARTTLYLTRHREARVVRLPGPEPIPGWCSRHGEPAALVGGFFTRPDLGPLGELRTGGFERRSTPFVDPWTRVRAAVHIERGRAHVAPRSLLPLAPRGDLLQAGPLLVQGGVPVLADGEDPEGFSAGAAQFDSDITEGRHPRAALGVTARGQLVAVASDGRAPGEAGLTLRELAEVMAAVGTRAALNLDGGGSTTLVSAGELVNVPRDGLGARIPGGHPVPTALVFR